MGQNNPELRRRAASEQWVTATVNRPSLALMPPTDWTDTLEAAFMRVAPAGLPCVSTLMCGSCANETAMKAAIMRFCATLRDGADPSPEAVSSCMRNEAPGTPDVAILSFAGGFHGRLFGSLSATRSKPIHKVDIPAFPWPVAPFPRVRYPLDAHCAENDAEVSRCLEQLRVVLRDHDAPVAAAIIEPIQGEGGDNHAPPSFFRGVQSILAEHGALMIVDEVQTGFGATGRYWAHEAWELPTPPDMVVFAKKAQAAGFYHNMDVRPSSTYRQFNTWCGDPLRALQAAAIVDIIEDNALLENVRVSGAYFLDGLTALCAAFPDVWENPRGMGTFCALDATGGQAARDVMVARLRNAGLLVGGSGDRTLRFRPSLWFRPSHVKITLDTMADVTAAAAAAAAAAADATA